MTNKLTLNLGLRYDYVDGMPIDQATNPNFLVMQAAGLSGRLDGMAFLEDFGKETKNDGDNIQPRLGFAYDLNGTTAGTSSAAVGASTQDFGYTNSNILFPALDSPEGTDRCSSSTNPTGIQKGRRHVLHATRSGLVDCLPQRGRHLACATPRPGGLADTRAAVYAADEPGLGSSAQLVHRLYR